MKSGTTRREFISAAGCAVAAAAIGGGKAKPEMTWGVLIHLGMNQWHTHEMSVIKRQGVWKGIPDDEYLAHIRSQYQAADHVRFDETVWREVSESYARNGINTIVLDLGEAVAYPSHPELAVKGTWPVAKLRAELDRLRGLGFEVIPKLNFSSMHCAWLGDYARMVSSKPYYRVCADLIRDVSEMFDGPRYFHLGLDEERANFHTCCDFVTVRRNDLWWHDVDFLMDEVRRYGARPMMWIDEIARKPEETQAFGRMRRDAVYMPWYYDDVFDPAKGWEVRAEKGIAENGFDVMPCGSLCFFTPDNPERHVKFALEHLARERVKGFLCAPWLETCAYFKPWLIRNGEAVARARKIWEEAK